MTHRGPFQPQPFCDSVSRALADFIVHLLAESSLKNQRSSSGAVTRSEERMPGALLLGRNTGGSPCPRAEASYGHVLSSCGCETPEGRVRRC